MSFMPAKKRSTLKLIAVALTLSLTAATAHADQSDDYVACLIGRAAVALHKQAKKDGSKALETAYSRCKEPTGIQENELEGLADYVSTQVDAMASQ